MLQVAKCVANRFAKDAYLSRRLVAGWSKESLDACGREAQLDGVAAPCAGEAADPPHGLACERTLGRGDRGSKKAKRDAGGKSYP